MLYVIVFRKVRVRASKLFTTSLFSFLDSKLSQKTNVREFRFFFFSVRQRKARAKLEKYIRVRCVKTVYDVTKKNWL